MISKHSVWGIDGNKLMTSMLTRSEFDGISKSDNVWISEVELCRYIVGIYSG